MLLVTLVLTGHAPAADAGEKVYACASRYFGFMRLVKHPRKCRRREKLITFPGASGGGGEGQDPRIEQLEAQNEALTDDVQGLKDANAALETKVGALEQANAQLGVDLQALQTDNAQLGVDLQALQADNAQLRADVQQTSGEPSPLLPEKFACISDLSTAKDLVFEGCNVHIRNGLGMTDSKDGVLGMERGTGNLIIGYDEDGAGVKDRTGSHNLVLGAEHTYSSFGGLVAGHNNSITGSNAAVVGGSFNRASGPKSSVNGGFDNEAGGDSSSVLGGAGNKATGSQATVSGGLNNEALSSQSSVLGGAGNQAAMGNYSSVSGGFQNVAAGQGASVTGGTGIMAWGTNEVLP